MGALPITSPMDLALGAVGDDGVILCAHDRDLCIVIGDACDIADRLMDLVVELRSVAEEVRPPAVSPTSAMVAVADLRAGDRVALDRCDSAAAPASHSGSWATVTDVVLMVGSVGMRMVRTDAQYRPNRTLRPEVQVWAMRPAAATGTDAEAAA
jgi:hypothetical protein